jgi:hypothetical protein
MSKTTIVIYKEADGTVPLREWLKQQSDKAQDKCLAVMEMLSMWGNQLRRPVADYLRDGIYELRTRYRHVNYRILYAFCGKNIVLFSHGLTKEAAIPAKEIERAIRNLNRYRQNPKPHTFEGLTK